MVVAAALTTAQKDLASLNEVQKALADSAQREKEIEEGLDELMERSSTLEELLGSLGRCVSGHNSFSAHFYKALPCL